MTHRSLRLALAALSTLSASQAHAAVRTWDGGGGTFNFWEVAGNWSDNATPGAADLAQFTLAGTTVVRWDNQTGHTVTAGLNVFGGDVLFRSDPTAGAPYSHTVSGNTGVAAAALRLNDFVLTTQSFFDLSNAGVVEATTGSTINALNLTVGFNGLGNILTVHNGAKVNVARSPILGENNGAGGTVIVKTAGVFSAQQDLIMGLAGTTGSGVFNIEAGGRLNVGDATSLTGVGFLVNDDNTTSTGGDVFIRNGSTLTHASGLTAQVGSFNGYGAVNVSGANSAWTNSANLAIGFGTSSSGRVSVSAGGSVDTAANVSVGSFGGTGTVNVDGANSLFWARGDMVLGNSLFNGVGNVTLTNGADLRVGDRTENVPAYDIYVSDADPIGTNGGVLSILNGSHLTSSLHASIGTLSGQAGRVIVSGVNSNWSGSDQLGLAINAGSTGDLRIESQGRVSAGYFIIGGGGTGTITVSGGGRAETDDQIVIGSAAGSNGTATVTGTNSIIALASLTVADAGTGTLNINAGGKVTAAHANLGYAATGVGTINLNDAGSLLDVEGDLTVGNNLGRGTINKDSIALIHIGDAAGTIAPSRIEVSDANLDGNAGGNFVFNNGSTMATDAVVTMGGPSNTFGRLAVNGVGSSFSTISAVVVGESGAGVLDVTAGGRVAIPSDVDGTELCLGLFGGGRGTVTVDGTGSLLDVNSSILLGNTAGNAVSTLTVRNGGQLYVGDAVGFAQPSVRIFLADLTLAGNEGGIIDVRQGSMLDASDGDVRVGTLPSSFGRINLNGANARLLAANVTLGGAGASGRLDVAGGTVIATGTLSVIGAGSQVNLSGGLLNAGAVNAAAAPAGFTFSGGTLVVHTFNGMLVQGGGTLAPGGAGVRDTMSIIGGYTLNAGTLAADLFATDNDAVLSSGAVIVGGALSLNNVSFPTTLGTNRVLIDTPNLSGRFASVLGLVLTPTRYVAVLYGPNSVLLRVARPGDANVDGSVNFDDLLALAQNYSAADTGRHWVLADFDGDGTTAFSDLLLLAQNYGLPSVVLPASVGATFAADWALAQSLVPEPGILSLLPLALVCRRRPGRRAGAQTGRVAERRRPSNNGGGSVG